MHLLIVIRRLAIAESHNLCRIAESHKIHERAPQVASMQIAVERRRTASRTAEMRRGDGQNRHFCGAFREKNDRSGALKLDESFIARVTKERDERNACQFLLPLQRHENKNQQSHVEQATN